MTTRAAVDNSATVRRTGTIARRPWKGDRGMDQELLLAYLRYVAAKLEHDAQMLALNVNYQQRNRIAANLRAIAAELRTLASSPPTA